MYFTIAHFYLAMAIVCEIVGTAFLKMTDSFTNPIPSSIVIITYIGATYFMTLAVNTLPIGYVYAIWAGVSIAAVATMGVITYGETMDWSGAIGIAMIIGGVVILNAFSKYGKHI